jgi:hypothetical protein
MPQRRLISSSQLLALRLFGKVPDYRKGWE